MSCYSWMQTKTTPSLRCLPINVLLKRCIVEQPNGIYPNIAMS